MTITTSTGASASAGAPAGDENPFLGDDNPFTTGRGEWVSEEDAAGDEWAAERAAAAKALEGSTGDPWADKEAKLAAAREVMAEAEAAAGVTKAEPIAGDVVAMPRVPLMKQNEALAGQQAYEQLAEVLTERAGLFKAELDAQMREFHRQTGAVTTFRIGGAQGKGGSQVVGMQTSDKVVVEDEGELREYVATHYPSEIGEPVSPTITLDSETEMRIAAVVREFDGNAGPSTLAAAIVREFGEPTPGPIRPAFRKLFLERLGIETVVDKQGVEQAIAVDTERDGAVVPGLKVTKGGEYLRINLRVDPKAKERARSAAEHWLTQIPGLPSPPVTPAIEE